MRWAKGELKFADLHASRIRRGMDLLKLQGCVRIDHYFLCEKVEELVRKNKVGLHARARLTIFRHAGGLYSPTGNELGYTLDVSKLDELVHTSNSPGLIIDVFDEVPKPINILSSIKTCSALLFVLAGIFKNKFSLDEVLIVNQNGFLCEGMSSNLFVVYKKKIYTPALSEGCVEGVMRSVVMRLAAENGLEVIEAQINPEILHEADEVFLTNVSRGIRWVMGFSNKRYFNEVSRFLVTKLNEL
jgi:branched-chain amino acid aminotransferase